MKALFSLCCLLLATGVLVASDFMPRRLPAASSPTPAPVRSKPASTPVSPASLGPRGRKLLRVNPDDQPVKATPTPTPAPAAAASEPAPVEKPSEETPALQEKLLGPAIPSSPLLDLTPAATVEFTPAPSGGEKPRDPAALLAPMLEEKPPKAASTPVAKTASTPVPKAPEPPPPRKADVVVSPPKTASDLDAPGQAAAAFFAQVQKNKIDDAYTVLAKGSKINERPEVLRTLKAKTTEALDLFGAIRGYELIDSKAVGSNLLRRTYISLGRDFPLRWRFYFYRSSSQWVLIDLRVDDRLGDIFDEPAVPETAESKP